MRKQTKVVAVASAAALLAIGGAMTSFAAQGWVEEDGTWYFYDKDGNRVEDEWKKSGDNWFWLDSEEGGAMATDKLIDDDNNTYYVDGNGVMVTNTWVKVVNEDQDDDDDPAEYRYYYMQSNGKAYRQSSSSGKVSKKTIDGKQYAFDDEGRMLYGWVSKDGSMANDDDGWNTTDEMYYFGGWEDGSMKTGWQRISVYDSEKEDDYDYWFNFKSNGERRQNNNKKKINGKYYAFDSRGVMVYEWYQTGSGSDASASNWNYFSSPEDGARYVKGWFKVAPPTEDNSFDETSATFASSDSDDESERWYYADENGLVDSKIKKIKGKYYAFAPEGDIAGRMLHGLCALQMNGDEIVRVIDKDMDSDALDDFLDTYGVEATNDVFLYYFGDADDGAMKTGSVSLNLDGDSYSFYFGKNGGAESKGRGLNGIYDDCIYQYGKKIKADSDEKYILVYADGNSGDASVTVADFNGSDLRNIVNGNASAPDGVDLGTLTYDRTTDKNSDDDTVNYITGFATENLYIVNTSGKIQDSKLSAKKDGDDWYWYALKNNKIKYYANSKNLKKTELENWDN